MPTDWLKDVLVDFGSAFGGALAGAYAAFRYEWRTREREQRAACISAGRKALFQLIEQHTAVANLYDQHLRRIDGDAAWVHSLPRELPNGTRLDIDSLSFLLDLKRARVLYELTIGEARFQNFVYFLRERGIVHAELQRELAPKVDHMDELPPLERLESMAGRRLCIQVKSLTENVIRSAKELLKSNLVDASNLRGTLLEEFPGEYFPSYAPFKRGE